MTGFYYDGIRIRIRSPQVLTENPEFGRFKTETVRTWSVTHLKSKNTGLYLNTYKSLSEPLCLCFYLSDGCKNVSVFSVWCVFVLTCVFLAGGRHLCWEKASGRSYSFQTCTKLRPLTWQIISLRDWTGLSSSLHHHSSFWVWASTNCGGVLLPLFPSCIVTQRPSECVRLCFPVGV